MKLQLKRKTAWIILAALLISGFNAGVCADVAGHAHDTVSAYAATEIQSCKTCGGDGLVPCNNPKGTQGGSYKGYISIITPSNTPSFLNPLAQ